MPPLDHLDRSPWLRFLMKSGQKTEHRLPSSFQLSLLLNSAFAFYPQKSGLYQKNLVYSHTKFANAIGAVFQSLNLWLGAFVSFLETVFLEWSLPVIAHLIGQIDRWTSGGRGSWKRSTCRLLGWHLRRNNPLGITHHFRRSRGRYPRCS